MKTTIIYLMICLLFMDTARAQSTFDDCVNCKGNTIINSSSALGVENTSSGEASFSSGKLNSSQGPYSHTFGYGNNASGNYSFAGGEQSVAIEKSAFAFGERAKAEGFRTFAQGMDVWAFGGNSVAIGRFVRTSTSNAMVIGYGVDLNNNLNNNITNSLMIGFNSNIPTLYIGPASGLNSSGKVGIGTKTPTERLHVSGTFKVSDISYFNSIVMDNTDIKSIRELCGNSGLKFRGKTLQTTTQMILTEDGKLGIGNISPSYRLDVSGDINYTGQLVWNGQVIPNNPWSVNGNNIYYNEGQVGIGTSIPQAKLHVESTEGAGLVVKTLHAYPWGYGVVLNVLNNDTKSFVVVKDNEDKYITYGNGRTVIGNSNSALSGYMLTVHGKIIAEELKIISDVPASDQVFEDTYNLLPINEVKNYISKNKHLPSVPSAAEFKANGYEVGKMDDLLLRKIEELTLYIIQQQKEIDQLKEMTQMASQN